MMIYMIYVKYVYILFQDTMLVANYNRILMDESWDDPEDFRPERFLDEDGNNIITPEKYFPFGVGKFFVRLCIGTAIKFIITQI